MRIGWLVYDDEYDTKPEFWATEPESWRGRIVQIVYAVIEGGSRFTAGLGGFNYDEEVNDELNKRR